MKQTFRQMYNHKGRSIAVFIIALIFTFAVTIGVAMTVTPQGRMGGKDFGNQQFQGQMPQNDDSNLNSQNQTSNQETTNISNKNVTSENEDNNGNGENNSANGMQPPNFNSKPNNNSGKIILGVSVAVAVIAFFAIGFVISKKKKDETTSDLFKQMAIVIIIAGIIGSAVATATSQQIVPLINKNTMSQSDGDSNFSNRPEMPSGENMPNFNNQNQNSNNNSEKTTDSSDQSDNDTTIIAPKQKEKRNNFNFVTFLLGLLSSIFMLLFNGLGAILGNKKSAENNNNDIQTTAKEIRNEE